MAPRWYVLHSKPNKEEFLCTQLWARGVEAFCPQIRVRPANPRARKSKPYFPGYVFVRLDLQNTRFSILGWTPGAAGLVSFGGQAADVPESLIKAIRRRVDEINAAGGELLERLKPGEAVIIQGGPFAGYEAIFDAHLTGVERVRVLLRLLQNRQIPLELSAGLLQPKTQL